MARPKIYDEPRIATAVRLPCSTRDALREAARRRDVSVNYLVIRAVSDLLERLADPEANETTEKSLPRSVGVS
jgi:hypothetical protein